MMDVLLRIQIKNLASLRRRLLRLAGGNIVDAFVDAMDEAGLNNLDGIDLCVGCMFDIKLMDGTCRT
ncbi:MAG: hypothetical protein IPP49_14120 [Saprospiraceae bacterium]|nr:hypothetical protein [Saprospiraceae bacterium]